MKHNYLVLAFTLFFTLTGVAQNKVDRYVEKADKKFTQLLYNEAIELYKKALAVNDEDPESILRLAECYRLTNQPEDAANWYERALRYYDNDPLNVVYYANSLMQLGRYSEAKAQYEKLIEISPEDSRGPNGVQACDMAEELMNRPPLFKIGTATFNSANSDFGPSFFKDDIVFASDRVTQDKAERFFGWTGRPYLDLYLTSKTEGGRYSDPERLKGYSNTIFHDGPATFSRDGNEVFFTRNSFNPTMIGNGEFQYSQDGIVKLKIMSAFYDEKSKSWGEPEEFPFNDPNYSLAHPALSHDGKRLFFSSDMNGSLGSSDIFMCEFVGGFWSQPVNLGPEINTEGEETFPYVDSVGNLYYASNGKPGLGGLDVFKAYWNEETKQYERATNLGNPINTSRDDMTFILKSGKMNGFFASNREGGVGNDDIYTAKCDGIILDVTLKDAGSGAPVKDFTMNVKDGGVSMGKGKTYKDGRFVWVIQPDERYSLEGTRRGYFGFKETIETKDMKKCETLVKEIEVEMNSTLRANGIVVHDETKLPIPNSLVVLTNEITGRVDSLITGMDGIYEFPLYPDITYDLYATADGYSFTDLEIETYDVKDGTEFRNILELSGPTPKYGLEFENIYFDLGKATLRKEAEDDLNTILNIMTLSSQLRIELAAHTDSRGSDKANEILSQKRAQAVVDWLTANGVQRSRMVPKGYGETQLKNKCANGVKCSEVEHQRNRRVEVNVVDANGNVVTSSKDRYTDGRSNSGPSFNRNPRLKLGNGEWKEVPTFSASPSK